MICPRCENPFTEFDETESTIIRDDWRRVKLRCPDLEGCGAQLGFREISSYGTDVYLAYPPEMMDGTVKEPKTVYMPLPEYHKDLPAPNSECPFCGGFDVDHLQMDEDDDEIEEAYVCPDCDRIIVYVYDREQYEEMEGFHESPPKAVYWEWTI